MNDSANISDDQELAQALAGVNKDSLPFEETGPGVNPLPTPAPTPSSTPEPTTPETAPPMPTPSPVGVGPVAGRDGLDSVKAEAINELRPLIGKLNLPPEEKFDTYLLLIRTTDDQELVPPAYDVARQIEDESRRAMALLDIIKEIDYLSNKDNSPEAK
ncbi:hypothetical protein GX865_00785 [Candidatus Saccharibacteria bacterium]|jgi:hypothetical protein|nr:hypothetical protein [Candidatus Saccharibacteria bacterium]